MDNENNIEFIKGSDTATAFFTQKKFISKIKKLQKEYPNDCEVFENTDGSILVHFPIKWIKINPPRKVTEEQRIAAGERMRKYQQSKLNTN